MAGADRVRQNGWTARTMFGRPTHPRNGRHQARSEVLVGVLIAGVADATTAMVVAGGATLPAADRLAARALLGRPGSTTLPPTLLGGFGPLSLRHARLAARALLGGLLAPNLVVTGAVGRAGVALHAPALLALGRHADATGGLARRDSAATTTWIRPHRAAKGSDVVGHSASPIAEHFFADRT